MHSDAPLDLLVGGFPCQDLSTAGNRAGLAGSRSGLFFEFARIIDALQPRWVLIENVPGLLSSNGGRDFGIVLGTLADLGYGVAWRTLDSRFFGVPQRRRRVFVLATVADGDPRGAAERAGEVLAVGSRCTGHSQARGETRPDVASTLGGSVGNGRGHDGNPFDRGGHSSLSGLGSGGPDDNDAQAGRIIVTRALTKSGGNDEEAGYGHLIAAPLTSGGHPNSNMPGRHKEDDVNLAVTAFHPTGGGAKGLSVEDDLAPGTGTGTGGTVAVSFTTRGRDGEAATEAQTDGVHPALRAGRGGGRRDSGVAGPTIGVRRLTPTECERLQGLPDGWTAHGPDSRRYSALGDAVTASVAEWIGRRLAAHAQSPTPKSRV